MPRTMALLSDSDPGEPGAGSARSAWRLVSPVIEPPPSESADVPV